MRKVFLDELPKKMRVGEEIIDWQNSIGHKVSFVYDDIEGEIEIIDCIYSDKSKLIIKYKNNAFCDNPIRIDSFKNCNIGKYISAKRKRKKQKTRFEKFYIR